ncbi:MAG: TonB-dependent receptor [Bacteroides sp.]|nr:TonB-dependent receptor [Bacteroides sp.]
MKKIGIVLSWLAVCLIFPLSAWADDTLLPGITVKGQLKDKNGEAIIGGTIQVENSSIGTTSDIDGGFVLNNIPGNRKVRIKISYVGYKPIVREINANGNLDLNNIILEEDALGLDEVIVVGYVQTKRNARTGAVSSVQSDKLVSTSATGFNEQIQGQAPGLIVSGTSGTPGSNVFIRLRGTTSINAGNDPLYIIDGIPFNSAPLQTISNGGQTVNPLADINPGDIERVEVLKDANATAVYGSRGANGVILITTKRGSRGEKTQVSFTAEYGFAKAAKLWELTTGAEHAQILNEAWINDGKDPALRPYRPKSEGGLGTPEEQQTYDRQSVAFRTAQVQNYNLSISGGGEKTSFYLGGEYTSQEAIIKTQDFERISFRFNLDHQISRKFSVSTSNSLSRTRRSLSRIANSPKGILQASVHHATLLSPYNEDGSYARYGIFDNIYALIGNSDHHAYGLRSTNHINATWKILNNLSFKSSVSLDYNNYHEKRYFNTNLADGQPDGNATDATSIQYTLTAEQLLNYNVAWGSHQYVTAFLGNSVQYNGWKVQSLTGSGFPGNEFKELASAAITTASTSSSSSGLLSWFGGINYSLFDRYSVDANFRADASSRFGEKHRWGYFPSVGVAWRMSQEDFLRSVSWIDELKLKGSLGWTGNQNIDDFASLGLWSGGGVYNDESGLLHTQLANPDLKWETTRQWNIGLEASLLENRLNLELNYYDKYTSDLLLDTPIAGKTGFSSIYSNVGEMSNRGIELQISSKNIVGRSFEWSTDFNISHNKNIIEKLPTAFSQYDRDWVRLEQGKPMYSFWLYKQLYVDPQTGNAVYDDVNEDGKITVADRQIVGDAWPDFTGGLRNSFRYGNVDLSLFLYFSVGNDVFNMNRFFQEHGGIRGTNWGLAKSQMRRWQQPGDITDIPKASTLPNADGSYNNSFQSSRFLEDGSFCRLRNVSLGYTLPAKVAARWGIGKARIYVNATNLFTVTGYSGADPESNTAADYSNGTVQGLDFAVPPQPRQFVLGINLVL